MIFYKFIIFFLSMNTVLGDSRVDPLVETKVGLIRGLQADDGDYSMFLGIPYATVNETNPFGPSLPYPRFEDPFNAYDGSAICPQKHTDPPENEIIGTLDCLHLNIFVPNSASSNNALPVMVFIYGGNFEMGEASESGSKFIVRHDVILVTFNYRVGVYGFMCLDIPEVPGNQGLKDQVAALRWISNNIESFGGDVNKITIFGESVGGRSIDLHLMSPQEKLFNKAIIQSGTAYTRDTIYEADTASPLKISEFLGVPTTSVTDALLYLSTVDPKLVVAATFELDLLSKPCVEKEMDGIENFIVDYPVNAKVSKVKNMPVMIGYNNNEQVARYADKPTEYFDDLNIIYDRLNAYFEFDEDTLKEMTKIVQQFYLGDEEISQDTMWEIIDFDSEFSYNHPTERTIRKYLDSGAGKIFKYVFSYTGGRNFYKDLKNVTVGGTSHADDLGYLFDVPYYTEDPTPEDQTMIDVITTLWTNFAKFSDPTPETSPLLPVTWKPVTADANYYLNITAAPALGQRDLPEQTAFWDLFYTFNWRSQKGYCGDITCQCKPVFKGL